METGDFKAFQTCMNVMAANFNDVIPAPLMAVWFDELKPYRIQDVQEAVGAVMRDRAFTKRPPLGEIVARIPGARGLSIEDEANLEASKVLWAVREHGAVASIVFDNPTTQATICAVYGGWPSVCGCDHLDNGLPQFFLQEFARHFKAQKAANNTRHGHLPGRYENRAIAGEQAKVPQIVRVGDAAKCQAVLDYKPESRIPANVTALLAGIGG